jgi:hypothetical protein
MADFPPFMKSPANRIAPSSQHTPGIEGYVFEGADSNGREIRVGAGQEYFIPEGTRIAGRVSAGTRTIHAFGGRRIVR